MTVTAVCCKDKPPNHPSAFVHPYIYSLSHRPLSTRAHTTATMSRPSPILQRIASLASHTTASQRVPRPSILQSRQWTCPQCAFKSRPQTRVQRRSYASQPGDSPEFTSIVDNPPQLVRAGGKKHGWGLLVLGAMSQSPYPMPALYFMVLTQSNFSLYPRHCFCTRLLAGPTSGLEDGTTGPLRGPPGAGSSTSSTSY